MIGLYIELNTILFQLIEHFLSLIVIDFYFSIFRFKEAESVYEDLLKRNPENVMYYAKLIEAKQLVDPDEKVAFFEVYK